MPGSMHTADADIPGAAGGHAMWLLSLGRQLDAERLHSISIIETDDGYIVRATHPGHRHPVLIEAPHAQSSSSSALPLAQTVAEDVSDGSPLLYRNGYATALHALGQRLDRQNATAIAISEGEHFVAVSLQPAGSSTPREELYLADDLALLIAQARHGHVPLRPRQEHPTVLQWASAQRPSSSPRTGLLRRLTAWLTSGVKQQPGG